MFSDRKSRISFGSSDVGFRGESSRTPLRKIGRMYTSPSMDRLSAMDRSTSAVLSRAKSIYDLSTRSVSETTSLTSSPIPHRSVRYQNVRVNAWRQSENFRALKNKPAFHRSRHDLHSTDGFSSLSSATQSLTGSRLTDPIAVLDRRDQLFSQLSAMSSPTVGRRVVPQLGSRSAAIYHWPTMTKAHDSWRPQLRERPLLSNLRTSIHSRSKKSNQSPGAKTSSNSSTRVDESNGPERRDSRERRDSGIYRNRYIIKFREHNLGQTPSQRRSSITWDLTTPFAHVKASEASDQSPISELLEPDPHLGTDDAESESGAHHKESASYEINESDNLDVNRSQIKSESKQSERVSDGEVEDRQVLSESEPKANASQLVTDILSVQTASVMPEPSGAPTGPLLQRALSLKSTGQVVTQVSPEVMPSEDLKEKVVKTKSPKKKKVKKKEQILKDEGYMKWS